MQVMLLQLLPVDLRDAYLAYLGIHRKTAPTMKWLTELHHAHLDRIAYTNLEVQLGHATTIDPNESVRRILRRRGGYCFHLNGAFASLLRTLGYNVSLARCAVPTAGLDGRGWGNHFIVLVQINQLDYIVDVGIRDGIRTPLPLAEGQLTQQPFNYRLRRSSNLQWRLEFDRRAAIAGFDFDVSSVDLSSFAAMHESLSTSNGSLFRKRFIAHRRCASHSLTLMGCVLTRTDGGGKFQRDVVDESEWIALVTNRFGIALDEIGRSKQRDLWRRVHASHELWDEAGRS